MEQLLHYIWKHRLFPLPPLTTTDGQVVEVFNPGLHNTNAGPDFSGAIVTIDGIKWVGNVEIHERTSDWFRHKHDSDPAYADIILHVVEHADQPLFAPSGQPVPQLELKVPDYVRQNYETLRRQDRQPRCADIAGSLPTFTVHNWMTTLTLERFDERTRQIMERLKSLDSNWEDTLFATIARNFGFGINGEAFEAWAHSIPMSAVAKHRDDLFQIEAIFFGQAGLLNDAPTAESEDYYVRLQKEYKYLRHKFSLTPIDTSRWRFLRLRPQNFPHVRIAQLAMLYYEKTINLSRVVSAESADDMKALLSTHVSDFWRTHYTFSPSTSCESEKKLSDSSINLIIINSLAPMLFAYGKHKGSEKLCQRAFELWQQLKPESNHIVRNWAEAGVRCESAADSQALIQLTKQYCDRRDCLRCKFGYEFIRQTPSFLNEDDFAQTETK